MRFERLESTKLRQRQEVWWSMHEAVAMVGITARVFFGAMLQLLKRLGSESEDGVYSLSLPRAR